MRRASLIHVLSYAVCLSSTPAFPQTCPPPPTSINPTVSATVSYDRNSATYTYSYILLNGKDSLLPINYFALSMSQKPSNIQSPDNWISRYINLPQVPPNLRWGTIVIPGSQASQVDGSDLPIPTSAVNPGQRLTGFSFQSSQGPGVLQYYVEGFTQIPASTPTADDDEPQPNCPGWDFTNPRFQTLVTGASVGPLAPNTISVRIRLRTQDGERGFEAFDPHGVSGNIGVVVLSSRSFDASKIDISSIRFGPGGAQPLSSRLVTREGGDGSEHGEGEEWEMAQETFEHDDHQHSTYPNLFLVFDLKSLAVQCVLDKTLFLKGTTQDGLNIVGASSSRTVGCSTHEPGVRRHN